MTLSITILSKKTLSIKNLIGNNAQRNETNYNDTQNYGLNCDNQHNASFTLNESTSDVYSLASIRLASNIPPRQTL